MSIDTSVSRRAFLAAAAASPLVLPAAITTIPLGLELYSVRDELKKDLTGTVAAVAKMGYQCVEFYAPYYDWTPDYARQVRAQLDSLGIRCYSTHNGLNSFSPTGIGKAIELNHILGTKYAVLAHPGDVQGVAGWQRVVETINTAQEKLQAEGLNAGYHNHGVEWHPVEGRKPMEILAAGFDKHVMLQLDVGTCIEAGSDPVAWINANPGRIRSVHLKDWSPEGGYKELFGEGVAPWRKILDAAKTTGGVEYLLIEQEGSRYPELETAEKCLAAYRNLHV
jgi:sugar phosphate isomerase/epimerase